MSTETSNATGTETGPEMGAEHRRERDRRRAEIEVGVDAIARAMLAELTGWPDLDPFVRRLCAAPGAGQPLREGASR
ncbi:hypothetical protein AB0I66_13000 [Streptomyces sp. NPDC050439]|uniref:hypothetical protein n=1 Tax=unclassified Streptomyces TaxID=2593676 RepID=UPI00341D0D07